MPFLNLENNFQTKRMIQFLLLVLVITSLAAKAEELHRQPPITVFILAGQSNMAGRGGVVDGVWDEVVPPESKPNPAILRLSASLEWEEAVEPLHRDIDWNKTCGIGPGMSFANSLLHKDAMLNSIGLVPCAIGGTNISLWERGTELYNQLVKRANVSVKGGGMIRAMLWYQGESDTTIYEDAMHYKNHLKRFLRDVRADLQLPNLPVIQVALASGEGPYVDIVRKVQLELDLPKVRCVDAKGFQLQPDGLHLSTQSQVQLGKVLAEAFYPSYGHYLYAPNFN